MFASLWFVIQKPYNDLKFQMSESGLVHRRKAKATSEGNDGPKEEERDDSKNDEEEADIDNKGTRLTLMEEVLLLGLKDKEGYTSFWNDCISSGGTHFVSNMAFSWKQCQGPRTNCLGDPNRV